MGQWIKQNQLQDLAVGRPAPGLTGTPQGLTASAATPVAIAKAISDSQAAKVGTGKFIGAPYTSVTCDGKGTLHKGDITHCTARGPAGTKVVLRAVLLDDKGSFGVSRRHAIVDTRATGAYLVSIPEDDGGLLTSADCDGSPYVVVDIPSAVFTTCALVDQLGRTGDEQLYLDADGNLSSSGASLSGGDASEDTPVIGDSGSGAEEVPQDVPQDVPEEVPQDVPSDPGGDSGGSPAPDNGGDAIAVA